MCISRDRIQQAKLRGLYDGYAEEISVVGLICTQICLALCDCHKYPFRLIRHILSCLGVVGWCDGTG